LDSTLDSRKLLVQYFRRVSRNTLQVRTVSSRYMSSASERVIFEGDPCCSLNYRTNYAGTHYLICVQLLTVTFTIWMRETTCLFWKLKAG